MLEFIKEYLPTTTSKIMTALMFAVVPSSMFLYDFLEKIGIEMAFLAKPEVRMLASVALLSLFLIVILVDLVIFIQKKLQNISDEKIESNSEVITPNMLDLAILVQVIRCRALNQVASPVSIAKTIGSEPDIVLAYLNKLHNDQQVTYITGGKTPTVDTDFFICPQGLERISLQINTMKKTKA